MIADNIDNRPLKIVVAIDKFRGSLSAIEAAQAVKDGFEGKNVEVEMFPMADGGEGSLDVVQCSMPAAQRIEIDSVNHLGYKMKVPVLLWGEKPRTAFIEMAAVCGLNLIPHDYRNIMRSTSFGLGDVMAKTIEQYGARKLIIALGGSGTSDGGFGMVSALGFRFTNPAAMRSKDMPSFIGNITEVDDSDVISLCPHLHETSIKVACDVRNPLLGTNGAVAVYSGQKGARPMDKPILENAMENWAEVVGKWYLKKHPDIQIQAKELSGFPGSGAAGGVGFAMKYMLSAELQPGVELFSQMIDLESHIAQADIVITGEGCFDQSSLNGKLPYGIAAICRKHNKPLWVITGRNKVEEHAWRSIGITRVEELCSHASDGQDSIKDSREIIMKICRESMH